MSKLSQARRRAARINGMKSLGPVSPEGRARSSQNAARHGVMSSTSHLNEKEKALAEGIYTGYARRLRPQDQLELEVVESLVMLQIKLRRLDRLELEAMDQALMAGGMNEPDGAENQKKYPSLATLGRYRAGLNRERKVAEERLAQLILQRPETESGGKSCQPRSIADLDRKAEAESRPLEAANDDVGMNKHEVHHLSQVQAL